VIPNGFALTFNARDAITFFAFSLSGSRAPDCADRGAANIASQLHEPTKSVTSPTKFQFRGRARFSGTAPTRDICGEGLPYQLPLRGSVLQLIHAVQLRGLIQGIVGNNRPSFGFIDLSRCTAER